MPKIFAMNRYKKEFLNVHMICFMELFDESFSDEYVYTDHYNIPRLFRKDKQISIKNGWYKKNSVDSMFVPPVNGYEPKCYGNDDEFLKNYPDYFIDDNHRLKNKPHILFFMANGDKIRVSYNFYADANEKYESIIKMIDTK